MRKRSLLVLALVACVLSGCSMISKTKDIIDNKINNDTENISDLADGDEAITDMNSDDTVLSDMTADYAMIFNENGIKLEINGAVEETDDYYRFLIDITNADHSARVNGCNLTVNNREMALTAVKLSDNLLDIKPNSSDIGYIQLDKENKETPNLDIPKYVEFRFDIVDNTTNEFFDDKGIWFRTSKFDENNFELDDSGVELYNKNGVRIVFNQTITDIKQIEESDAEYIALGTIYAENNSEYDAYIDNYYANIDGYEKLDTYFYSLIHPGNRILNNLMVYIPKEDVKDKLYKLDNIKVEIEPNIRIHELSVQDEADVFTFNIAK